MRCTVETEMVELPDQPAQPGEAPGGPAVIPEPYPPPDEGNPARAGDHAGAGAAGPEEPKEGRAGA